MYCSNGVKVIPLHLFLAFLVLLPEIEYIFSKVIMGILNYIFGQVFEKVMNYISCFLELYFIFYTSLRTANNFKFLN